MTKCNIGKPYNSILKKGLNLILKKTALTNDLVMSKSKLIQNVYGADLAINDLKGALVEKSISNSMKLKQYFNKSGRYKEYILKLKGYSEGVNKIVFNSKNTEENISELSKQLFSETFGKETSEIKSIIRESFKDLDELYGKNNGIFLLSKYTDSNINDGLTSLMLRNSGTLETQFYLYYKKLGFSKLNKEDIKNKIITTLQSEISDIASDRVIKTLAGDLLGDGIKSVFYKSKVVKQLIIEGREVSQILKFSLSPATNALYTGQALILSTINYLSKKRGNDGLENTKLFNYLFDDLKFLDGQSVEGNFDVSHSMGDGVSYIARMFDFITSKTIDKAHGGLLGHKVKAVVKGGGQVSVDMFLENNVKKQAVLDALSKMGINLENADEFHKMLTEGIKSGKIDGSILNTLRTEAGISYNRFFTHSELRATTRDRFSSWMPFSFLQHYVIARSAEMIDGFRSLYKDYNSGVLMSMPFSEYLYNNRELRTFIYTSLDSLTYAHYVNVYLGEGQDKNDTEKQLQYYRGLNDQMSSLDATMWFRTIKSMIVAPIEYKDLQDGLGEETSGIDYVSSVGIALSTEILRSLFREIKPIDAITSSAGLYLEGNGSDAAIMNMHTMMGKAINGSGRFGAVAGFERYGMKKIDNYDDTLSYYLMGMSETNESLKAYSKLRTQEGILQGLENGIFSNAFSQLLYSNPTKFIFNIGNALQGKLIMGSESKFNLMKENLQYDSVLRDLYNGNFNIAVLEKNGQLDTARVAAVYKDLINFDYSYTSSKKGESKGSNIIGNYNPGSINSKKDAIFTQDILNKIGEGNFMDIISQGGVDINNQGVLKILVMAEGDTVGAGRAIVSYMASQEYLALINKYTKNQTGKSSNSSKNLPESLVTNLKASIVQKYYGASSSFLSDPASRDKHSWFKLIEMRNSDLNPNAFKISKDYQTYYNALGMLDYVAYTEGKKANPNIQMLQNIFATSGKFIKDPKLRLEMTNHVMRTINTLDTNQDVKTIMQTGVLVANMGFVGQLTKNPDFYKEHKEPITQFNDFMFTNNGSINKLGSKLMVDKLSPSGGKYYYSGGGYTKYGKNYNTGTGGYKTPSNTKNANLVKQFQKKITPLYKLPKGYKPRNSGGYTNLTTVPYANVRKSILKIQNNVNFFRQAKTKQLVTGYVRKSPNDVIGKLKFRDRGRVHINRISQRKKKFI